MTKKLSPIVKRSLESCIKKFHEVLEKNKGKFLGNVENELVKNVKRFEEILNRYG